MTDPQRPGFDEEISVRGIVGFSVGVIVVSALAVAGMWALNEGFESQFRSAQREPLPLARSGDEYTPPSPNLQTFPEQEFDDFLRDEIADLHSYRLLDSNAGTVQIPIDEAIDRIVRDGIPEWEAPATEGG